MRLHPFAGKTYASPNGCNTNSDKFRDFKDTYEDTNETYCYSKSYSPESSLDYERQVMLQRCFVVVFAVSEFVLQPLSDA